MAEFHETVGGRKFYDADVPRMVKALEGLQKAVEQLVKAAQPVAPAPAPEKKCGESICCDEPDCAERENKEEARSIARQNYESDGEIEFDDDAEVSFVFSGPESDLQVTGAYVQAWVWVEFTANKGGK